MTKKECIKKAYLELFDNDSEKEKRFADIEKWIDNHGWFSGVLHNVPDELLDKSGHEVRPKTLNGIEDNNGWTKIENDNFPEQAKYFSEIERFFVFTKEKEIKLAPNANFWYWRNHYTHYKPIQKPKPPLY